MRILGIDPGSLNTGYGVIESDGADFWLIKCGCITNKSPDPSPARYQKIYSVLRDVIRETRPDTAALENVIYCNNARVAIKLGEARGVAILAGVRSGVSIKEYSPKSIKQAIVGNGNASKQQVQMMVKRLFKLNETPPPDIADAIAAAVCHLNSTRIHSTRIHSTRIQTKIINS